MGLLVKSWRTSAICSRVLTGWSSFTLSSRCYRTDPMFWNLVFHCSNVFAKVHHLNISDCLWASKYKPASVYFSTQKAFSFGVHKIVNLKARKTIFNTQHLQLLGNIMWKGKINQAFILCVIKETVVVGCEGAPCRTIWAYIHRLQISNI